MSKHWPTKDKDMAIAHLIMEEHAHKHNSASLGLFELVVNQKQKRMNFRLSKWVLALAQRFNTMYGANQGEQITRLVVSWCILQGETLH